MFELLSVFSETDLRGHISSASMLLFPYGKCIAFKKAAGSCMRCTFQAAKTKICQMPAHKVQTEPNGYIAATASSFGYCPLCKNCILQIFFDKLHLAGATAEPRGLMMLFSVRLDRCVVSIVLLQSDIRKLVCLFCNLHPEVRCSLPISKFAELDGCQAATVFCV